LNRLASVLELEDVEVALFVLPFVPEMATQSDLELLAEIAEMLADKAVRERLKQEGDAASLYATISGWGPRSATESSDRRS